MTIPAKAVKITPNDRGVYANLNHLYLGQAPNGGTGGVESGRDFGLINVRYEDDSTEQLYFGEEGFGATELGLRVKQVLETDSDVGVDGRNLDNSADRADAIYAGNWLWGVFDSDTTLIEDRPPRFTNTSFERTVDHDQGSLATVFTVTTVDDDFDDVTIAEQGTWDSQFSLNTTSGVISYTEGSGLTAGTTYDLVVRATANSVTTDATFQVHVRENRAPVFDHADLNGTRVQLQRNAPTTANILDASATDPDGDTITYSERGTWDSHFSLDTSTGMITFTNDGTALTAESTYTLRVRASDGSNNSEQDFFVDVPPNQPPWITAHTQGVRPVYIERNAPTDSQFHDFNAVDPDDDDTLEWSKVGTWDSRFDINSTNGTIGYTKGTAFTPGDVIELTAQVSDGLDTDQVTLPVIVYPNRPPEITSNVRSVDLVRNAESKSNLLSAAATDPDHDSITYAEVGTWDSRFSLSTTNGVISYTKGTAFTPEQEFELQVNVSDGDYTVLVTFTVVIAINRAPVITNTSTQVDIGTMQAATQTLHEITGTDADNDTITWSEVSSSNSEFGFAPSTRQLTYDGTLSLSVGDAFQVVVRASDGDLNTEVQFDIVVS